MCVSSGIVSGDYFVASNGPYFPVFCMPFCFLVVVGSGIFGLKLGM